MAGVNFATFRDGGIEVLQAKPAANHRRSPRSRQVGGAGATVIAGAIAQPLQSSPHLLVLAFQTDLTRVATVLLSIEQSPRAYGAEIGISEGHHGLTHHSGD